MTDAPKLLKARQKHTRVFAIAAIALVLVSHPALTSEMLLQQLMLWIGYFLVAIGAFGRVYCSAYIGGRKNDEVVAIGPFSVVRNPLYVCSFIALVGIGLESGMVSILLLLAGTFIFYYPSVIAKEEAFLEHKFGDAYRAYKTSVPRWIPNFKQWNEPEHMESKPTFIRRTIGDALAFFLPLPLFVLVGALHAFHILPVWITLP